MSTTGAPQSRQGAFDPGQPWPLWLPAAGRTAPARARGARPARPPTASWPQWVHPAVCTRRLAGAGVGELWSHQREAADLAHGGSHVVMATGTSGKSWDTCSRAQLAGHGRRGPNGRGATALYLSPTKALAADQVARLGLAIPPPVGHLRRRHAPGGAPLDPRPRAARPHQPRPGAPLAPPPAPAVGALPAWTALRGGRRVPRLPRRVRLARRRAAASAASCGRSLRGGADFVLASATVRDPATHASRLVGLPVRAVERDGSPREAMTFGLWEPGELPGSGGVPGPGGGPGVDTSGETPVRRSATSEAADLLADLVAAGVQTVASRGPGRGSRPWPPAPVARWARWTRGWKRGRGIPGRLSARGAPGPGTVAARRVPGRARRDQRPRAGIDISGLDAAAGRLAR